MNFLTLSYWFAAIPVPFLHWAFLLLVVKFSASIVLGVVLHLIARRKRHDLYWREGIARFAAVLFQTGLVGLVLVWFTQQQVGFFGARAWFVLLAVVFVVRIALIVRHMTKVLPGKAASYAEQARIRKYLP